MVQRASGAPVSGEREPVPPEPAVAVGPPELLSTGPATGHPAVPPPQPATEERSRWHGLSLRWRLVLGLLVVVAVALAGCGVATYAVLQRSLVSQIDDGLTSVRDQALRASPLHGPTDAIGAWQQQGAGVFLVTAGSAQRLTATYGPAPAQLEPVGAADLRALQSVSSARSTPPVTISLSELGEARAVAVPVTLSTGERATLVAATPLSRVSAVTRAFVVIELVALLVALLVVTLAASWWIRRSLRPLQRVAQTAGQVATLPLDRGDVTIPDRVPEADPASEIGQVASAMNAMLDHVERSLRARQDTEARLREFVSDAGHELRTPLASIRGYAELVRRAGDDHPGQALASAARIESAAARMGGLVDDLLLLASLEEGRPLEHRTVDLARLADDAIAEIRVVAPEHDWQLGPVGPDVSVPGDPARLHQVVTNLLSNAATYTPPGTTVRVSALRIGPHIQLEVRDDGPGFPADLLPRATERFARGDASRSRTTGGSGLGLAIVRAVAEAHGGHVAVANDAGAVVTVHLPTGSG